MSSTVRSSKGLDLAVVGNSRIGALIDTNASVVWMCVPRFDGDPVFCSLLNGDSPEGRFDIELERRTSIRQHYLKNTAILRSEMEDADGGRIEIIDFAPRFHQHGRIFAPVGLVRIVRKLAGRPRVRVRFLPRSGYGEARPPVTFGTHHIRAEIPAYPLRLTTDAPITHVIEHNPMLLDDCYTFVLGPDETLQSSPSEAGRAMLEETQRYWRRWVRNLAVPFDWQDAVIRAAITLKLNTFDDTGAVIAALTTSVPEAPNTERNWDYRYCWLRDAYFVINALNRLGATGSLERYLRYIENIIVDSDPASLQPVYGLSGESRLTERLAIHLAGFDGMGPVRVGNQAWEQVQHDVYGAAILGVSHAFFDHRLDTLGDRALLQRLEPLGEQAYAKHMQAGRRHLGIPRPARSAHVFRGDVLGRVRPPGQDRGAGGPRSRRATGASGPTRSTSRCARMRGATNSADSPPRSAGTSPMQACSCSARSASCTGTIRACAPPWPRSSDTCAAAISCCVTTSPMTSASRTRRSSSARSGGSSRWRCSASGTAP